MATIQPYLNQDRVVNLTDPAFVVCPLCQGILWIPICCQNCGTPYCRSCVKNQQAESSTPMQCPPQPSSDSNELACSGFIEHKCSNLVRYALSKLTVKCRYEVYGCKEIPSYNHLETHEEVCGYQQKTCSGCNKDFALQDLQAHENICSLFILTCSECNTKYERQVQDKHTETRCLREQLLQVRAFANNETKSLYEQLLQVKALAENETRSLREQLHNLTTRLGQLENKQNGTPTDDNAAATTESAVQITEVAATAS